MSQRKVSLVAPDWFDLAKYAQVGDLDIWGWHWNIMKRLRLRDSWRFKLPDDFPFEKNQDFEDQEKRSIKLEFEKHLQYPVVPRRAPTSTVQDGSRSLVNDMTVIDTLYHAESLLESDNYARAFEAHKYSMSISEDWASHEALKKAAPADDSVNDFLMKKFPGSSRYVYAEIDIQAPIDKLVESFRRWILDVKQSRGQCYSKKRQFTDVDFSKWTRYRLLAYFDLMLWAEMEGVNLHHDEYVRRLFPDRDGDVMSFFRRTVKDEADSVFTWDCCYGLQIQGDITW
ncbi:DUF6387 family protein [Burkholderia cepacia]|uniref:DUF6387 family protein n=1 Tax=Burkholderia cepacia TaxID=292 RepID=UPI002AB16CCC|nr:DUF6387 family protein [Burkholderia cepacia]